VAALVAAIEPFDDVERSHQADVLAWLASTPDVYRRVKPATPPRHLVSYAVLTDPRDWSVFLVDHRLAGLWLPAGGHVEPGEEPAVTAAREAREELGIDADFSIAGRRPVFVTIARTSTRTSACGTCWPGARRCPSRSTRGSSRAGAGGPGHRSSPRTPRYSIRPWAASWPRSAWLRSAWLRSAVSRGRSCWRLEALLFRFPGHDGLLLSGAFLVSVAGGGCSHLAPTWRGPGRRDLIRS
jgi:hypothetical protein